MAEATAAAVARIRYACKSDLWFVMLGDSDQFLDGFEHWNERLFSLTETSKSRPKISALNELVSAVLDNASQD